MKSFNTFVESVIDIPRNSLDPVVFQFVDGQAPILNPAIKKQIIKDVALLDEIVPIKTFYMVGSILTKTYTNDSDIDVNVEFYPEDVDDIVQEKLISILKVINGRKAVGTIHPINYYVSLESIINDDRFDAVYDIQNERWIKEPQFFEFNVTSYINNFMDKVSKIDLVTAQLRRDIVDYDELSKFNKNEIKDLKNILQSKLYEINQSIDLLIDIRKTMKKVRKEAFKRPMTPEEIEKYHTKNRLPQNVVYKLLQKYYYWNFIDKINEILGERDDIGPQDVDDVKDAQKKLFGDSIEQEDGEVITEIRKLKLRKDWRSTDRTKSFLQVANRGMDRQNLRQVPQSRRRVGGAGLGTAVKQLEVAKKAPAGIWRITPLQVQWISQKFHHNPPVNKNKPIKHLGNTGIMIWRKARGFYYLVKQSQHFKRRM